MPIKPMVRNNICLNSHPAGCAAMVRGEIEYVKKTFSGVQKPERVPKLVLVVGCSTGYGLASRVAAAFGYGAATVGISFEKAGSATKPGTPGWYDNLAFDKEAAAAGLPSITLDGDAFSSEMKAKAVEAIKEAAKGAGIPAQVDLVVYSLASPVRTDPKDGVMYRSVIKPVAKPYAGYAMDVMTAKLSHVAVDPATEEEVANTVKVMGGEDWELWIDALKEAGVLAPSARTVAYSYIGPELSWGIYKDGTIGKAKEHLEGTAKALRAKLAPSGGGAWISVNKALVTRSSAVIPIISLYISSLFKIMKAKGLHEGCIEQMTRLFQERLYSPVGASDAAAVAVDGEGRIRLDDKEMIDQVQKETAALMAKVTEENLQSLVDYEGFRHDFLEAHGFDVEGVDYDAEIDPSGI